MLQPRAVSPLDHVFGLSASIVAPAGACPNCWRVWLAGPRNTLGYCWHGRVAWRVRPSGEFIAAPGTDKTKHLAMVRALQKREPPGFAA
jgi:hypothetical protein